MRIDAGIAVPRIPSRIASINRSRVTAFGARSPTIAGPCPPPLPSSPWHPTHRAWYALFAVCPASPSPAIAATIHTRRIAIFQL